MTPSRTHLLTAGALAVTLAAGYGLARLTERPPTEAVEASHEIEISSDLVVLDAAQIAASGIRVAPVERGGGGEELRLSGRVEAMPDSRVSVASIVDGRVERMLVSPGQNVRAGQPLAILLSLDAATLRADAEAASAAVEAARAAFRRDSTLHAQGWVATQRLDVTRAEMLRAEASARASRARAAASGSPDSTGRLRVLSPMAGAVLNVATASGGHVEEGVGIVEIADAARREVVLQAPPSAALALTPGVVLRIEHVAGALDGRVVGISVAADDVAGNTAVRVQAVRGTLPPPGAPVTGVLVTGRDTSRLTVPSEAIQTVEGRQAVFVVSPKGFRVTPVLTGRQAGGRTEILSGLTGDERVVAAGAFLLKAELAKGDEQDGH